MYLSPWTKLLSREFQKKVCRSLSYVARTCIEGNNYSVNTRW